MNPLAAPFRASTSAPRQPALRPAAAATSAPFVEVPAGETSSRLQSLLGPEPGISIGLCESALSPAFFPYKVPGVGSNPGNRGVLRISGFAAEISRAEVLALMGAKGEGESVHFGIDRQSGETIDCYIEYESLDAALVALAPFDQARRNGLPAMLGRRTVRIEASSQSAMMIAIFPKAKVIWSGAFPNVDIEVTGHLPQIITNRELNQMMDLAEGKTHPPMTNFTNKNHARIFENMISVLKNFPWFATQQYTLRMRTSIYITTQAMFESLLRGVNGYNDPSLTMKLAGRYFLAAVNTPGFSEIQKRELIQKSRYLNIGLKPYSTMAYWPWSALVLKQGWEDDVVKYYGRIHSAACYSSIIQINRADINFSYHHCFRAFTDPDMSIQQAADAEMQVARLLIKRSLAAATLDEAELGMVQTYLHMIKLFRDKVAEFGEQATCMSGFNVSPGFLILSKRNQDQLQSNPLPQNMRRWRAPASHLDTIIESPPETPRPRPQPQPHVSHHGREQREIFIPDLTKPADYQEAFEEIKNKPALGYEQQIYGPQPKRRLSRTVVNWSPTKESRNLSTMPQTPAEKSSQQIGTQQQQIGAYQHSDMSWDPDSTPRQQRRAPQQETMGGFQHSHSNTMMQTPISAPRQRSGTQHEQMMVGFQSSITKPQAPIGISRQRGAGQQQQQQHQMVGHVQQLASFDDSLSYQQDSSPYQQTPGGASRQRSAAQQQQQQKMGGHVQQLASFDDSFSYQQNSNQQTPGSASRQRSAAQQQQQQKMGGHVQQLASFNDSFSYQQDSSPYQQTPGGASRQRSAAQQQQKMGGNVQQLTGFDDSFSYQQNSSPHQQTPGGASRQRSAAQQQQKMGGNVQQLTSFDDSSHQQDSGPYQQIGGPQRFGTHHQQQVAMTAPQARAPGAFGEFHDEYLADLQSEDTIEELEAMSLEPSNSDGYARYGDSTAHPSIEQALEKIESAAKPSPRPSPWNAPGTSVERYSRLRVPAGSHVPQQVSLSQHTQPEYSGSIQSPSVGGGSEREGRGRRERRNSNSSVQTVVRAEGEGARRT